MRAIVSLLSCLCLSVAQTEATTRAPFKSLLTFLRLRPHEYTPLVLFTVPPGLVPECDAMEQTVRRVERDLGVTVQRLDILRDPASEAVMNAILGSQGSSSLTPPLLYHRESRQMIHIVPPKSSGSSKQSASAPRRSPLPIDADRVRAWAKGRYLFPTSSTTPHMSGTRTVAPRGTVVDDADDGMLAEAEQLTELSLTPEQLLGKRRMEERTQAKSASVNKALK